MAEKEKISVNQIAIIAVVFIFFYALVYLLSLGRAGISSAVEKIPVLNLFLPLPEFESPMYFLLPVVAFFLMYFSVDAVNKKFETEQAFSPIYPALYIILSLLAFYVALFWYYGNIAILSGMETVEFDFFGSLRGSAFYYFIIGGFFGWIARFANKQLFSKS